jgi:hypothetical protein
MLEGQAPVLQEPLIVLPVEVPHIVMKCPLQFAVGLRMPHSGVNQTNAQLLTECLDEVSLER